MLVPPQTAKIFEWLSKGLFINSQSANKEQEELYEVIATNYEALQAYFQPLNFQLERGPSYFFFSRTIAKTSLEDKLTKLYRYIDALDFFLSYAPGFGVGYRFETEKILLACQEDRLLKRKLRSLDSRTDQIPDKLKRVLDMLAKDQFIEAEDDAKKSYRVLHAFEYLETLLKRIQIDEP